MRRQGWGQTAFALAAVMSPGCGGWVTDSWDTSCKDLPCGWELESGRLERTDSWHAHQPAFSFAEPNTRVSLLAATNTTPICLEFQLLADVEPSAQLELQLDFNDDGNDHAIPVPPGRWTRARLRAHAPSEYRNLRLRLEKLGAGRAVVEYLAVGSGAGCTEPAITLRNGSPCTVDTTCASGRCVSGQCAECGAGGCVEGESCRTDQECMDGACAAGVCRACAKLGTCGALERCAHDGQCASNSCVFGSVPSMTSFPSLDGMCAECKADSDCASGMCVLGRCSACRTDAECASDRVCRYQHPPAQPPLDALTRACEPKTGQRLWLPRGALCESDDDCEGTLRCSGPPGRAKRCGVACGQDTECAEGEICSAAGATQNRSPSDAGVPPAPALPFRLLPAWSQEVMSRARTCYPIAGLAQACVVHDQCGRGPLSYCCDQTSHCSIAVIDANTGQCASSVYLPHLPYL